MSRRSACAFGNSPVWYFMYVAQSTFPRSFSSSTVYQRHCTSASQSSVARRRLVVVAVSSASSAAPGSDDVLAFDHETTSEHARTEIAQRFTSENGFGLPRSSAIPFVIDTTGHDIARPLSSARNPPAWLRTFTRRPTEWTGQSGMQLDLPATERSRIIAHSPAFTAPCEHRTSLT